MIKKPFFFVIAVFFATHAVFDFLRMMLAWDVVVGPMVVPTWMSGIFFIFSVFMVYWSFIVSKEKPKQ